MNGTFYYEATYSLGGTYYYYIWANDTKDNNISSSTYVFHITLPPPAPSEDPILPNIEHLVDFIGIYEWGISHWIIEQGTLVCFDRDFAMDNGIVEIYYKIGMDGNWTLYTDCIVLPPGTYEIYYYGIDVFGRHTATARIIIEVIASNMIPTTSIILNPSIPDGMDGWYVTTPTIQLQSFDEDGDHTITYYRIDDGMWTTYTDSFIVDDGTHTIAFYSVDEHGAKETMQSRVVRVDLYAPEITLEKPQNMVYLFDREIIPTNHRPIIIGKLTIKASVSDPHTSGVDTTTLQIDDTVVATFDDKVEYCLDALMLGEHTITITSADIAGNTAISTLTVWMFNL
jgi:hypothetical protein